MSGGMRLEKDAIRAMPLGMQQQVGVALAEQMEKALPKKEPELIACDSRVFARCPYNGTCGSIADAKFAPGSDCHRFSQKILNSAATQADKIRGMSDRELATFLHTATRACADHNCEACPIGSSNCKVMLYWLRTSYLED